MLRVQIDHKLHQLFGEEGEEHSTCTNFTVVRPWGCIFGPCGILSYVHAYGRIVVSLRFF